MTSARAFAEHLRSAIAAQILTEHADVTFTASFGIAQRELGMTAKAWTAKADAALYRAKDMGRNCVVCSERELQALTLIFASAVLGV